MSDPQTMAAAILEGARAAGGKSQAAVYVMERADQLAAIEDASPTAVASLLIQVREVCGNALPMKSLKAAMREKRGPREATAEHVLIARHADLKEAIQHHLRTLAVGVDAVGRLRDAKTGQHIPKMTLPDLADRIWDYLSTFGEIRYDSLFRMVRIRVRDAQAEAFARLRDRICGKAVTPEGLAELHRFVRAIIGPEGTAGRPDETLTLAVFCQFMWCAKRSLAGLPRERDLMPILFNPIQGTGKSTAVARLVSPLEEVVDSITAETLADERKRADLGRFVIGVWNEMEGASRRDVEDIKSAITGEAFSYRPMGTNDNVRIPRLMNFIGTSNKPSSAMIRDTTGNRRFGDIRTADVLDHATINAIDYDRLWTAVSESDAAPILAVLGKLQEAQERDRYRDSVSEWLEEEAWQEGHEFGVGQVERYDPELGDTPTMIRTRYRIWCRLRGEREISDAAFLHRLDEERFEHIRPRAGGRQRRYKRPVEKPAAAPGDDATRPPRGVRMGSTPDNGEDAYARAGDADEPPF